MEGLVETFFLENCSEFSELIRTGNLDVYLLKPIDEQFLISSGISTGSVSECFVGAALMGVSRTS